MEADETVAVGGVDGLDLGGEQPVPEGELHALARFFAGAGQALPQASAFIVQQDDLDRGGAPLGQPHQPRGDDAGIVQHQAVTRPEVFGQVAEMPVADRARLPVGDHQP